MEPIQSNLPNVIKNHQLSLKKLCRLCGRRKKGLRKITLQFKHKLLECSNINLFSDNEVEHPCVVCSLTKK